MHVIYLEQYLVHSKHSVILVIFLLLLYKQYIHNKNNIKIIIIINTVITDGEGKMKHTWVYRQSPLQKNPSKTIENPVCISLYSFGFNWEKPTQRKNVMTP